MGFAHQAVPIAYIFCALLQFSLVVLEFQSVQIIMRGKQEKRFLSLFQQRDTEEQPWEMQLGDGSYSHKALHEVKQEAPSQRSRVLVPKSPQELGGTFFY